MKIIPFIKYTHCGNNFVIVNETSQSYLSEEEKLIFAHRARDVNFGIGSDNLLVIQPFKVEILKNINHYQDYWSDLPNFQNCDFIFRFFDTAEALSCGNGLLCISRYLYERYGIENAHIMTEVPLSQPNILTIGFEQGTNLSWCNLGNPRRVLEDIVPNLANVERHSEQIDIVYGLKIDFRKNDLCSFTKETSLLLNGYLTFTGEPHLVIFPDNCMPPKLANTMFLSNEETHDEKRKNFGSWLINHIGNYINKYYQNLFPVGINVNFARILDNKDTVQYRTFERGNNYETLACGTGAVAVSYVAKKLELITNDRVNLLLAYGNPHQKKALLLVDATTDGWILKGKPLMLCKGQFLLKDPTEIDSLSDAKSWRPLS